MWHSTLLGVLALLLAGGCKANTAADVTRSRPCRQTTPADTPAEMANVVRRRSNIAPPKMELSFHQIEILQDQTDRSGVLQGIAIPKRDSVLKRFALDDKKPPLTAGEGDVVAVKGFLVGTPHVSRPADFDPCKEFGYANNDYLLNLGEFAGDTEYDTIVAVMTPHTRNAAWDLERLRSIARSGTMVRISGQLFYDSKHRVNRDPVHELDGQPRRLSLWEIHPVSAIEVCRMKQQSDCRSPGATFEPLEYAR